MTVEILYPEVCGLYGDAQNAEYLRLSLPEAEFIYTDLCSEPYFVKNEPDIILLGSMSEEMQRRVLGIFEPLKHRLNELTEKGTVILATGNAAELFCDKIEYITEKKEVKALGFFPFSVKTDLFKRYNGKVLGETDGIKIVGFRSQFSFIYGDNSDCFFLKMIRGDGINKESKLEGMRKKNLICTTCLGPILPLNPLFTEHLISLAGGKEKAAFREEAMEAYNKRLSEFEDPKIKF
ncbi:MAG: hypothetical protein E7573_09875 [Ruminococcaceae bacterium]|nr:hypothetical protein [Oscillospiraceae bacterium]